ncbi:MAG TPA: N-formylglutamate amidohydrolase [Spongiibacteraceae bacterium]|jgi:N-formylglutamate amidohydrolase|nr:N-formylglutamate amidohydrolase [Spongiibacteraceae bacterium]
MTDQLAARIVLNIPHASTYIPDQYLNQFSVPGWALHYERLMLTDWFTQVLFNIEGSHQVIAEVSRLLLDTERFVLDKEEPMAQYGMGVIYTHGSRRQPIRRTLTASERQELLDRYYHSHHQALTRAVQACLDQHGECFLIDCHSFWNEPMAHESDKGPRPDFCIGTNATNAPDDYVASIYKALARDGASVRINSPYSGSMLPAEFTGDQRVKAAMIEINRKLYMTMPDAVYGPEILDSIPTMPTRTHNFIEVAKKVQKAIFEGVAYNCAL